MSWDPETDSTRPLVGAIIIYNNKQYHIEKVSYMRLSEIVARIRSGEPEPEAAPYDIVLTHGHETRPAVYWMVWCNRINSE